MEERVEKKVVIVRLKGVKERNEEEEMKGKEILIESQKMKDEEMEEEEFLKKEMIGIEEVDGDGK